MHKFSIVIPVYNVAPYLRECLESVLRQTYDNWEMICVDDGSKDGSGAILDEYAANDGRIKVFHTANSGVSSARNLGLENSTGDFVWFVDGDDVIHQQSLEAVNHAVDSYGCADLIIPKWYFDYSQWSQRKALDILNVPISKIGRVCNTRTYWSLRLGGWLPIYRRALIENQRFQKFVFGEDCLFALQAFWRSKTILTIDDSFYFYRRRPTSVTVSVVSRKVVMDHLKTEVQYFRWLIAAVRDGGVDNSSLEEYYANNRDFFFFTYGHKFFHLQDYDMRLCLPYWVKLQRIREEVMPISRIRKIMVAAVGVAPLPVLVKMLHGAFWFARRVERRLLGG